MITHRRVDGNRPVPPPVLQVTRSPSHTAVVAVRFTLTIIMIVLNVAGFAVSCWLGCYLLSRDPRKPLLRRIAVGLLGYALALACMDVPVLGTVLLGIPAVAWTGVLLRLPAAIPPRRADTMWRWLYAPVTLALLAAAATTNSTVLRLIAGAAVAAGLLLAGVDVLRRMAWRIELALLAAITVMFGLGIAGVLLGLRIMPAELLLIGIGVDLVVLGGLIAGLDALDTGQVLRRDLWRSALTALAVTVLFGGQVALVMAAVPTGREVLTYLMFGCVGAAIAVQVLAAPLERAVDRLTLTEPVRQSRSQLRQAMASLPRRGPLDELSAEEFARLTRRALSDYADVGRLVASPLTALPVIDERLAERAAADLPLERAAELKTLLRESIDRLRPAGECDVSPEWRYYNSLYFIYVRGLRPYSLRARHDGLDPADRRALEWLRTTVPQRSLHNWQNAAARLIADTLRHVSDKK